MAAYSLMILNEYMHVVHRYKLVVSKRLMYGGGMIATVETKLLMSMASDIP